MFLNKNNLYIDAHCHLTDKRGLNHIHKWIEEALNQNISFWLQGGICPTEWQEQIKLKKEFPKNVGLCFGIHPYWLCDANNQDHIDSALDELSRLLPSALALGELGLDLRKSRVQSSEEIQKEVFRAQIELAEFARKPLVLHLVHAYEEAKKMMLFTGPFVEGGIVHSFNGSIDQAQFYLNQNLKISFGGPLARNNNKKLFEVAKWIPLDQFVLETDSPDQPPDLYKGELNPLKSLFEVARIMALAKAISVEEVFKKSNQNFCSIFFKDKKMEQLF